MSALTLVPVSVGVYTALNVAGVTALASGPYDTQVPQGTAFPYVWFTVTEQNARGLGRGGIRRVDVRVHVAAQGTAALGPAKQIEGILAAVVTALEDATLTVTGFRMAGEVFYSDTDEPFTSEIGGATCWEAGANFYLWVEP